jgi:serine/threonine-protein kinase
MRPRPLRASLLFVADGADIAVGFDMRAVASAVDFDPDRTRVEGNGAAPATSRLPQVEALGRGSLLAGKYRLEQLLGEGGMGFVWSAYNVELELPVAIKLLRAGPRKAALTQRFRLEAKAAARLVHPSIVRVLDIATTGDGDPFIVMELLTGESLAKLLTRGRLSGARAVQLLLPIAEALVLAHAKGIVHRDLKPDNVLLSEDGEQLQPKLLDFGIAKLAYRAALTEKLTTKGTLIGSPHYMSPEQARGEEVDYRSDIWSFSVMLYEAVAGAAPFRGADKRALVGAILDCEPAAFPAEAGVDAQLAQLIRWGLEKDRARRPASMRALGRALSQWLLESGVAEDACGAPLAAKWNARTLTPSPYPPPSLTVATGSDPDSDASMLLSPAPNQPNAGQAETQPELATTELVPNRRRYWGLLVAASILLVGSGGIFFAAGRDRGPRATARLATTDGRAPELPAAPMPPFVLAASPVPAALESGLPPEPGLDADSSSQTGSALVELPEVAPSSTTALPVATPKSQPDARRRATLQRLPFH